MGVKAWTKKHREWIKSHVHFEQPALEATLADYLEEVDHVGEPNHETGEGDRRSDSASATGDSGGDRSVAGTARRRPNDGGHHRCRSGIVIAFPEPTALMGYSGLVPSEHSSGNRVQRGAITKTGNGHLRRVIGGSGLGVSASTECDRVSWRSRQKRLAISEESQEDRLEGATAAAQTV